MADSTQRIMALTKQLAGINLMDAKRALVEGRLSGRLRDLQITIDEYAQRVEHDAAEQVIMIDLLTTNHTAWMREVAHFTDFEKRVLPKLAQQQPSQSRPRLRVWCAAAATGEEPWSIALSIARSLPNVDSWDAAVLATDISTRALAKAETGEYDASRVEPLSPSDKALALDSIGQGRYRVNARLRSLVTFGRLNLINQWPMRGPFDVIFCRNVMIYFDRETQRQLCERMIKLLAPGGTLYIGHSENLNGLGLPVKTLAPAIYIA